MNMAGSDSTIIAIGMASMHLAGLLLALHAMRASRTPQGSLAWMFALVALPYVSIPLYLALGSRRFKGYVDARKRYAERNTRLSNITRDVQQKLSTMAVKLEGERLGRLNVLPEVANLPICRGNSASLLVDGDATYSAMADALKRATSYILLEFYIIKNDKAGAILQEAVIDRVKAGVQVYMLYDEIGSHKLPVGYIRKLRKAGVRIESFNGKRFFLTNIVRANFRNHRKLVIVDGREAFVGGLNVGVEYVGRGRMGYWRDTFLKLEGPAVLEAQLCFLEDWHWATYGDVPAFDWTLPAPREEDVRMMILPSGPVDSVNAWNMAVISMAQTAQRRLWLTTPYFVPNETVLYELQLAALRGVQVRILVPHDCDHKMVQMSSSTFIPDLLPSGVEIYAYMKGFLHEKVALVDDDVCCVGTANLDNRSLSLNFELTALMCDRTQAQRIAAMLEEDFRNARLMQASDWERHSLLYKLASSFARLMAPVQ